MYSSRQSSTSKAPYIHSEIDSIRFTCYTDEEIKKISVRKITESTSFDVFGNPVSGGLYDAAMGPIDKKSFCETCGLGFRSCPGHFGRIELPLPVYTPFLFKLLLNLLRISCLDCCRFAKDSGILYVNAAKLKLIRTGHVIQALELDDHISRELGLVLGKSADGQEDVKKLKAEDELDTPIKPKRRKKAAPSVIDIEIIDEIERSEGQFEGKTVERKDKYARRKNVDIDELKKIVDAYVTDAMAVKIGCDDMGVGSEAIPLLSINENKRVILKAMLAYAAGSNRCKYCQRELQSIVSVEQLNIFKMPLSEQRLSKMKNDSSMEKIELLKKRKLVTVLEINDIIHRLWENEADILNEMFTGNSVSPEAFFIRDILVPPNVFRPVQWRDESPSDFAMNIYYKAILVDRRKIQDLMKEKSGESMELYSLWNSMQDSVNSLFDSSKTTTNSFRVSASGIKQILEKKEGLFRRNMMGKRVNYAARSVISPDPYLETDEIGLPDVFAMTLTYPEGINTRNIARLKGYVLNGNGIYPGAFSVENLRTGKVKKLERMNESSRAYLAEQLHEYLGKGVVRRHLIDGDYVLVNRQPTLHKPSIMCLRAKVLFGEKTIRMHYSNCKSMNADFDGDEVNVHFPQNEIARAEAALIAHANGQYIVPTNGVPIRGLIQDHIVSGVLLTKRDTFLSKGDYMHLAIIACGVFTEENENFRITLLNPCILKPQKLWTGKQLISTILINLARARYGDEVVYLTMKGKSGISSKMWSFGKKKAKKSKAKAKPKSLWGDDDDEERVYFLNGEMIHGILEKKQFGSSTYGLVHAVYEIYGENSAGKLLTGLGRMFTTFLQMHGFSCCLDDMLLDKKAEKKRAKWLSQISNSLDSSVTRDVIDKAGDADEHEVAMDNTGGPESSGAAKKGENEKELNEEELEKLAFSLRTHREETIEIMDSLMKSALSRQTSNIIGDCIPNGLQKQFPANNFAVMTFAGSKGSIVNFAQVSCLLGQQELEGKRVPMMPSLRTLPSFSKMDFRSRPGGYIVDRFLYGIRPQEFFYHCMAGREGLIDTAVKTSNSGYLQRCLIKHLEDLHVEYDQTVRGSDGSVIQFKYGDDGVDVTKAAYLQKLDIYTNNIAASPQDSNSIGRSGESANEKSSSDEEAEAADAYSILLSKRSNAQVDSGEAVGLLAAQSVGEPSTQMTLNTFHLAGHGAINVTLGIPRLREIIMTASSSTPTMTLMLKNRKSKDDAAKLVERLSRMSLRDIIHAITVRETIDAPSGEHSYLLSLGLDSQRMESSHIPNLSAKLKAQMTQKFIPLLQKKLEKELRMQKATDLVGQQLREEHAQEYKSKPNKAKKSDEEEKEVPVDFDKLDDLDDLDDHTGRKTELVSYVEDKDEKAKEKNLDPDFEPDEDVLDESGADYGIIFNDSTPNTPRMRKGTRSVSIQFLGVKNSTIMLEISVPVNMSALVAEIAEDIAKVVEVSAVEGITKCVATRGLMDEYIIQTDGVNLFSVVLVDDLINIAETRTTNIRKFAEVFGIEAGRALIIEEINSVFKVYGIEVDYRHLNLIADYMTFTGSYVAMNRIGMRDNTSPFKKMSFETTMSFLKDAIIDNDIDTIKSPSSSISIGQVAKGGTGSFELLQDVVERF